MASLILIFIIGAIIAINVMPRLRELRSTKVRENFWSHGGDADGMDIFSSLDEPEARPHARRRTVVEVNEDSPSWPHYVRSLNL